MKRLLARFRERPMVTTIFLLAATLACVFVIRGVMFAIWWSDPAHRDQAIEGWMTPRYVARSWDVPHDVIGQALGFDGPPARRMPLREIAAERGVSVDELSAAIIAAITVERARTEP